MKPFSLVFILIASVFINCKSDKKPLGPTAAENISIADTLQLTFDNSNKWLVNLETHEGVKNMDSILKEFESENAKDYEELGDNLSKQTSYIIKNCTMTGESHDQLHVVLVPMLDEISVLRESNNSDLQQS